MLNEHQSRGRVEGYAFQVPTSVLSSSETDHINAAESPPNDVWVDDRLMVRDSPIDGRGLFARDPVPEGTVVLRLGGRLVSSSELADLVASANSGHGDSYVDTITVDEDSHLVLPAATIVHYGNHSCDTTLWHVGPYDLATRRDLSAGEEATIDYGTHSGAEGFVMACSCLSKLCRGTITSDDWRQRELQQRFAGHWVPALQRRIDSARTDRRHNEAPDHPRGSARGTPPPPGR